MTINEINQVFCVGMINAGTSRGSCFIAEHNGELYVVTAYHVLFNHEGTLISSDGTLFFSNQETDDRNNLYVNITLDHIEIKVSPEDDLALFKYDSNSEFIAEARNNDIKLTPISLTAKPENELWTTKVYILGFPTSLCIDAPFDTKPMVASGVVSAYDRSHNSFIVNAPVYYGNSGCPVLRMQEDGTIEIVGIVQRLVMFNLEWKNPYERELSRLDWHNAGYTICLHASRIQYLLD